MNLHVYPMSFFTSENPFPFDIVNFSTFVSSNLADFLDEVENDISLDFCVKNRSSITKKVCMASLKSLLHKAFKLTFDFAERRFCNMILWVLNWKLHICEIILMKNETFDNYRFERIFFYICVWHFIEEIYIYMSMYIYVIFQNLIHCKNTLKLIWMGFF